MKREGVRSQKETEAKEDLDAGILTAHPQDIFPDGGLRAWLVVCGVCDLIPFIYQTSMTVDLKAMCSNIAT